MQQKGKQLQFRVHQWVTKLPALGLCCPLYYHKIYKHDKLIKNIALLKNFESWINLPQPNIVLELSHKI